MGIQRLTFRTLLGRLMAARPIATEVLKLGQQKVYSLTIGMQSLQEALRKHAPDLYQKYEEAYPALVHGPLLEAHAEEQRSLAEILRILGANQKAN
jgi:hypothetical protein